MIKKMFFAALAAACVAVSGCTAEFPVDGDKTENTEPGNDPDDDPGKDDDPSNDPDPVDDTQTSDQLPDFKVVSTYEIDMAGGENESYSKGNVSIDIIYDGASVTVTSNAVGIKYVVSGTTTNGSLKIYSEEDFAIELSSVKITNPVGPAINIQRKSYCFATLKGTSYISDNQEYTPVDGEDQKGCFFSEGPIVVDGTGTLNVSANYKHAIASDSYVRIDGGSITASASAQKGHGAASNGAIFVNGGKLDLAVSGAAAKGLNAGGKVVIAGGETVLKTTGAAIVEDNDTTSPSCVKADEGFEMSAGTLIATATGAGGKAISTDADFRLLGGSLTAITTGGEFVSGALSTSPKAIKADGNAYILDGECTIDTTSEGLEAEYDIVIEGGTLRITAADDAINASADKTARIAIRGGRIYAYSSTNDAIDSNGTFAMSGGLIVAAGTSQPEGGIDCDQNSMAITGGTIIAVGGATSYPTSASTRHSIVYGAQSVARNDWIEVRKTDGDAIAVFRVPRAYQQMVMLISDSAIAGGQKYTITRGGSYSGGTEQFAGYYTGGTYSGGTATDVTTSSSAVYTTAGTASNNGGGPGGGGIRP